MTDEPLAPARLRFRAGIGGEPIVAEVVNSPAHAFETASWGAWLVGSSSHPMGGDHLGIHVAVGVGCCAEIRSHAATVARRARSGEGASSTKTRLTVASDGMCTWMPEPSIASDGADHLSDASVQLASNARLLWQDDITLDRRSGERPGTWRSRLRVTRDSWPVFCTELSIGAGAREWASPVVLQKAKALSVAVVVDPARPPSAWASARTVVGSAAGVALPLSSPGIQLVAWGDELDDCRTAIEQMLPVCGAAPWVLARWKGAPMPLIPGLGDGDHLANRLVVGGDPSMAALPRT